MREVSWTNPAALTTQVRRDSNVLYPLSEFYEESGLPMPAVNLIEGREVPPPYHRLLVHERDMTPTLEAAHGQSIHLQVLKYSLRDGVFSRQVLLVLEDGAVVEFGAIKIYLAHLPDEVRRLVLERRQPLGSILQTQRVEHKSHPAAYLRVSADRFMQDALGLAKPTVLFGRCNVLSNSSKHVLARVVEVLPPWNGAAGWEGKVE
jgi:chorismate-pyruvate lyase